MFYSPLRYPGGKNKLAKFVALICEKNNIDGHYIEPYAGGASVALYLLINGYVKKITINDLDIGIYAFWHSILNDTEKFCRKIRNTEVTIENWEKFKKVHDEEKDDLFNLGFATFFLNRTNYSGIIDGGMIGGMQQGGKYKINCRFNKKDLIKRIRSIAKYKDDIDICNLDALELIKKIQKNSEDDNVVFYFDPPYYLKGPSLYMNHYKYNDHKEVSNEIKKIKNMRWIVSYDNTSEIKRLYIQFPQIQYSFFHTANEIKEGKEILFFSKNLLIPETTNPTKI